MDLKSKVRLQAGDDAEGLREECKAEGRTFGLQATDDWDSVAWGEVCREFNLSAAERDELWPVYHDSLRSAIRAMGGQT